jgi:hypothetical protein
MFMGCYGKDVKGIEYKLNHASCLDGQWLFFLESDGAKSFFIPMVYSMGDW